MMLLAFYIQGKSNAETLLIDTSKNQGYKVKVQIYHTDKWGEKDQIW